MEHGGHTIILNDLLHTDFKNELENVLNEYPIFDEEYRAILNEKIINHYRFREIGFYSPDKFNFKLYVKLNEILPFYNVMYKKLVTDNFDLFNDYDYMETYDGTSGEIGETKSNDETNSTSKNVGSGSDTSNSTTTSEDTSRGTNSNTQSSNTTTKNTQEYQKGKRETKNLESDTPQGNTSIASIISGGYLSKFNQAEESNAVDTTTNSGSNKDTNTNNGTNTNTNTGSVKTNSSSSYNSNVDAESKSTGSGTINSTRDGMTNYIRKVTGYQGRDNIELFNKYLKSLLNIDLLIIKELEELFFIFY